tara:strand:+ start:1558 stop:1752 length:195 start_codon:yes stop_codon:yes gene_type:complete
MKDIKIEKQEINKMYTWDYYDTIVKYYEHEKITMLEPTARNMNHLMNKVNELIIEVNILTEHLK